MKSIYYLHKGKQKDNRIYYLNIEAHTHGQMIFDKGAKVIKSGDSVFTTNNTRINR